MGSALAEHCSDFVGVMDADGVALFLNRSVRGASKEQVEGKRLEEFLSADRARQVRILLQAAKRTGRPSESEEVHVIALDGTDHWFAEKCVPIPGGDHFLLVRTETTHLRRNSEALSASEERYRVLFDLNPDPVVVYAAESLELLAANTAAERFYGWTRDELSGRTVLEFYPDDERETVRHAFEARRALPLGDHRGVITQRRSDGATLRAEVVDHPIEFRGHAARICVLRDVTERERLETQLRQAQKLEAVGVFAGGVAHDFNNLLSAVAGFASVTRESAAPGSEIAEDMDAVLDAVRRGSDLTKQLLLFTRKQAAKKESVDLAEVVVAFSALLRRFAGNKAVLEVVQAAAPLPIFADRTLIEQVIMNLVINAGQAMPEGGRITITASRLDADAGFVEEHPWARVGSFAELSVADSGVGMDAGTVDRMFEPFFTTKAEGTGLGLAVVHGIAQQHGALVSVASMPGFGTTFRFLFPLAPRLEDVDAVALRAQAPRGSERLLVAEDEPQLRYLAERGLSRLGYQVVAARDGAEALREFEQNPDAFDLVVLDVVMPTLGGCEAWTRMRTTRPKLRALFVTGHAPESVGLDEVLREPESALLRKPFTSIELAERVRKLLDS